MVKDQWPINEVAQAFGMRTSALRYYEEIGLVQPSSRKGRVRQYDMEALRHLALVLLWHADGAVPISDTLQLLGSDRGTRRAVLQDNIDRVERNLTELGRVRAVLLHMLECDEEVFEHCPITQELIDQSLNPKLAQLHEQPDRS